VPEGAAGVDEQDLDGGGGAVHEEAGTGAGHGGGIVAGCGVLAWRVRSGATRAERRIEEWERVHDGGAGGVGGVRGGGD
jgi:hypothetical protein